MSEPWEPGIREIVRDELRSLMAAALADPDVDPAAKSFAGYSLQWLNEDNHTLNPPEICETVTAEEIEFTHGMVEEG
jgi:hypothetical protein